MELLELLKLRLAKEQSIFQKQLLNEDIARLETLQWLAEKHNTKSEFIEEGMYIGWTKGDMRTAELKEPLEILLSKLFDSRNDRKQHHTESEVIQAWINFNNARFEKLVHCL